MCAKFKLRFFTKSRKNKENTSNHYFSEIPTNVDYSSSSNFTEEGDFDPKCNFSCNFYQKPISSGLVQTNTIVMLGEYSRNTGKENGLSKSEKIIRPIPLIPNFIQHIITGWKLFLFIDTENQGDLKFFTVNKDTEEVSWTDRLLVTFPTIPNIDEYINNPTKEYEELISESTAFHIGFRASKEGQYENKIHFCEIKTKETDPNKLTGLEELNYIGCINVYSTAIGEDERYRTFFSNFGIPDPISYINIFKDESEEQKNRMKYDSNIDYDVLNRKSKELFLSYDKIFPYIGTYKALVNAVDFLGYDDIYFKEWFKEISPTNGTKPNLVAYNIKYKSKEKGNMLSDLPTERRIALKKLNWLSMIYKISEEVKNEEGDVEYDVLDDNVCFPKIKENYDTYESTEILQKLISLKEWLQKYIIGVNCRIIEISGEGITFERYKYKIYGKYTTQLDYLKESTVSPYLYDTDGIITLGRDGADIKIGLKELNVENFRKNHKDFVIKTFMSTKNAVFGPSKTSNKSKDIPLGLVDIPLLLKDGEIFFDPKLIMKNNCELTSKFLKNPVIQIENARLRSLNDEWNDSIRYTISNTGDKNNAYKIVDIANNKTYTKRDYVTLKAVSTNSSLEYTADNILGVPLFVIQNFQDLSLRTYTYNEESRTTEYNDIINPNEKYILEILDGKFIFSDSYTDKYGENTTRTTYLNFNFDTNDNEQSIEVNYVYEKTIVISDIKDNNSHATINVKNIGEYLIYAYIRDEYNNIFCARCPEVAMVTTSSPNIKTLTLYDSTNNSDDFFNKNEISTYKTSFGTYKNGLLLEEYNNYGEPYMCVLKEQYLSNNLKVVNSDQTENSISYIQHVEYPTISYAIDTPKKGDYAHFMSLSDRYKFVDLTEKKGGSEKLLWVVKYGDFNSNTIVDSDINDNVNIILYDNIHAFPLYQTQGIAKIAKYTENEDSEYYGKDIIQIPISNQAASGLFAYIYENEENKENLYPVRAKNDADEKAEKVALGEGTIDIDNGGVDPYIAFRNKKLYTIYLQAIHETKVESATKHIVKTENNSDDYITITTTPIKTLDDNDPLYYPEQIIKLGVKKSFPNSVNKIEAWTALKVIDASIINSTNNGNKWRIKAKGKFTSDYTKETDTVNSKTVTDDPIFGENDNVYVSHAHQAFVDYPITVDNAFESQDEDGIVTHLFLSDTRMLDYIDNTFSVSSRSYDVYNAYEMWMQNIVSEDASDGYPIICDPQNPNNTILYVHSIPTTIKLGQHIIADYEKEQLNDLIGEQHAYWKISRYDYETGNNELLFESWNDALYLTPNFPGIYSLEVNVYDYCGNMTSSELIGAFRVIE